MIDPTIEDDDLEFVEIYNSSSSAVDLTDWRIRRGIDFDFAKGTALPAGGTLVVVSFDPVVHADEAQCLPHALWLEPDDSHCWRVQPQARQWR